MRYCQSLYALAFAMGLGLTIAGPPAPPVIDTRSPTPENSDRNAEAIARALMPISLERRDQTFSTDSVKLDTSWVNAVLYKHSFEGKQKVAGQDVSVAAGVEISCINCYIKGTAQATFTVAGSGDSDSGNFTRLLLNYAGDTSQDILNKTGRAFNTIAGSLAKDAQEFINRTNALKEAAEEVAEAAYNKTLTFLKDEAKDSKTFQFMLSLHVDKFFESEFNETRDLFLEELHDLQNSTLTLQGKAENVTKSKFDRIMDELRNDERFQSVEKLVDQVDDAIERIETKIKSIFQEFKDDLKRGIQELEDKFHVDDIAFPTIDVDFNMPLLPAMPGVSLQFRLDGIELYMELNAALSAGATYTLPLYTSNTPIGVSLGRDVTAGVVVSVDLILDIQAQIDISSGFHLKIDDRVAIDIEMFAQNVSHINFPGAQFEFLPVKVISSGAVIQGVLRVELKAGLELNTPKVVVLDHSLTFGAGVQVNVFANLAKFVTNITGPATGKMVKRGCDLEVVEYFEFNLGAAAGATLALGTHKWGPTPETSVQVFYTTLASVCAGSKTTSTTPAAVPGVTGRALLPARQDPNLITTTLISTLVFVGQSCVSSGLIHCPASLQTTTAFSSVVSLVTSVSSGVSPVFPLTANPTKIAGSASAVAFGSNVKSAFAISGVPTSFDPSSATNQIKGFVDGSTGGVSNKLILGVSLGLGLPLLIGMIVGFVCFCRRRRIRGVTYAPVAVGSGPQMDTSYHNGDYHHGESPGLRQDKAEKAHMVNNRTVVHDQ